MRQWLLRLFAAGDALGQKRRDLSFYEKVGTVNAPNTQLVLNSLTAAISANVDPQVRIVPTLLNRGPQETAVKERLDALYRQPGPTPPLLVVLPGSATDRHEAFVTRFGLHDLKSLIADDAGYYFVSRLTWPSGHQNISSVLGTVRDGLSLPPGFDHNEMERWLATMPASICFSHYVDGRDWDRDEGVLIKKWVDYLCTQWPHNAARKLVVAFLCIEQPAPLGLASYLAELRERSTSTTQLVVTPDMEPIRRKHIDDWIGTCSRLLQDEYLAADLQAVPRRLFPESEHLERSFDEVYEQLVIIWQDVRGSLTEGHPVVIR